MSTGSTVLNKYDDEWVFYGDIRGQTFISKPQYPVINVGGTLTLKCTVTEKDPKKMNVMWMRHDPIMTFSVNDFLVSGDTRVSIEGKYNLRIENITEEDAGAYQCMATKTGSRPVTQESVVAVTVPPTAKIVSPKDDKKDVMLKEDVTLDCEVGGKPAPNITWTRKGAKLPNGDDVYEGNPLVLTKVHYDDGGVYICSAVNSRNDSATDEVEITVTYAPSIEVAKNVVYSGPGFDCILTCLIVGNPTPDVNWYHGKDLIEKSERQNLKQSSSFEKEKKYILELKELVKGDFGVYTCTANNSYGNASYNIELSGLPSQLRITSDPIGKYATEYFLQWTITSYAPPEIYKLELREVSENSTDEWVEKTIPAQCSDRLPVVRTQGYVIKKLLPSTEFEVVLSVKNMFGWGKESEKFLFRTNNAGITPPPVGIHYGSENSSESNGTVINLNGSNGGDENNGSIVTYSFLLSIVLFLCLRV